MYTIKGNTMNAIKSLSATCGAVVLSLVTSTATLASSGATSKVFVSGPLILLFLGFCALVVVIQCIPAIILLYGMIKGTASAVKDERAEVKK
jgi:hypothetical protein